MSGEMMDFALMANKLRAAESTAAEISPVGRLIACAQAGDSTAFDQIILGHQRKVIAVAWRMLGNQDDARDAAQEVFLRIYRHINKFDPNQDFSGWLYRIIINVCRDFARKRGRANQTSLDAERESGSFIEPISSHDVEADLLRIQEHAILLRALDALTEKERAAIVLRDLEGLATEEVARILGSSPTTVRSQISSARMKIRIFRQKFIRGPRK